jgi:hypothetical protein
VQQSEVAALVGLPEAVVKNCILIPAHAPLSIMGDLPPNTTEDVLDGAIRRGLPQGSRASQLIAGMLLGPTLKHLAPADRLIVYGDDIAIAACNEGEATALKKALPGMLKSHPAGPFRLKHCDTKHINKGFDFLKYHFRRNPFTGKVRRRPATKSYSRYERRVVSLILKTPKARIREAVEHYTAAWAGSFIRWRPVRLSFIQLAGNTAAAVQAGLKIKSQIAGQKLLKMTTPSLHTMQK